MGWSETLPSDRISAIAKLRKLLDVETDPIERHFMFNELEIVLYKCRDVFESAFIDGADHFTIFWRLILPLSMPVLAAFAIFQFLWTWNDYLIALTMVGANPEALPATVRIASLAGEFGLREHLLTAGAFVQAFVPLIVFFALQRFFVRGILAGSVKG